MSKIILNKSKLLRTRSYQTASSVQKEVFGDQKYLDYQFIQCSKIPTLHFQKSLPRLPIPKLELTCERYLAAQRPLLIEEAYRKTESNVNQFLTTIGKQLQTILKDYDKSNKHTSYISDIWFDMYLKDRQPLPINYNPILVMHNDERHEYNDQLTRATNLIISSLRFYKSLSYSVLEPEVFHLNPKKSDNDNFRTICSALPEVVSWYGAYLLKAYPLDMKQYSSLFKSTRIPETDKDRLYSAESSTYITVQRNGHFYVVRVLDEKNDILPAEEIMKKLNFVLNDDVPPAEFPIGPLTTLERNRWATLRKALLDQDKGNKLNLIDSSLFHVCLDTDSVEGDPYKVVRHYLHADSKNRWFDKSFSLIITKDGYAGLNFEHAWGDGVAILRYFQDIYKDSRENPQVRPDTKIASGTMDGIYRLDFTLNDGLKEAIKKAQVDFAKVYNSLDINYLLFDDIGKNVCKAAEVSPDAVMQLGFQVAYHKLAGKFVPSYESCSTAAFKHGRTEAIRPCTMATKEMSLAINRATKPSMQELKLMLHECSRVHNQLTKEAAMGQGFDRHLFALKYFAQKQNIQCNIFDDPEFASLNHNILSTSTLSSPAVFAGGFGPVVQDGLGIGYVIRDDSLGVLVTNYSGMADSKGFVEALKKSYLEILEVLKYKN